MMRNEWELRSSSKRVLHNTKGEIINIFSVVVVVVFLTIILFKHIFGVWIVFDFIYALDVCGFVIDLVYVMFLNTYLELINLSKSIRFILTTDVLLSDNYSYFFFEKCPLISRNTWWNILSVIILNIS